MPSFLDDSSSLWSFDNNTLDSLSNFHGTPINSPTYKSPGINGYGFALSLNRTRNQCVRVTNFRNLSFRSFTVQMWFYLTTLTNADHGLFEQKDSGFTNHFLHYIIRNERIYLGFYFNDISGITDTEINTWYHVTFVYDYSLLKQFIYLNGKLDRSLSPKDPYQGQSGSIFIGARTDGQSCLNSFFG